MMLLPLELLETIAIQSGSMYLACAIRSRHALRNLLDRPSTTRLPRLDARTLFWVLFLPEVEMGHIAWPVVAKDALKWPLHHQLFLLRHKKLDWGYENVLQLGYGSKLWIPSAINTETVEAWLYNHGCTKSKLSFIEDCLDGWDLFDKATIEHVIKEHKDCCSRSSLCCKNQNEMNRSIQSIYQ